jgi:osmotically-inducible protein OsmY
MHNPNYQTLMVRRVGSFGAMIGCSCLLAVGCASDSQAHRGDRTARDRTHEHRHEVRADDRARARAERLDDHDRVPGDDRTVVDNSVRDNVGEREDVKDNLGVRPVAIATPTEGGTDADRALATRIRDSIANDNRLSTNAKNVEISSSADEVTLRGPVANAADKSRIATLAEREAGTRRVNNQLVVTK